MISKSLHTLVLASLLCCGCASTKFPYDKTFEPHVNPVHGHVVRVNLADQYVVLECTVLPFAGEQITLYRDEQAVARVQATPNRERHFLVADLLEGTPRPGDWFRGSTKGRVPQQRH